MNQTLIQQKPQMLFNSKGKTMIRFILTSVVVAAVALISSTSTVEANPGQSHSGSYSARVGVHSHNHSLHVNFRVRDYRGWTSYCYFSSYRCYGYCDAGVWYYWYEPMARFLPVSYMSAYPPINTGFVPVVRGPRAVVVLPTGVAPVAPVSAALPVGATPIANVAPMNAVPPSTASLPIPE